jgi:hypothetical protein
MMKAVRMEFVIGMKEHLAQSSDDILLAHQLLLVFSSLASKGSDEVEDLVMNVLSTRTAILKSHAQPDISDIDLLLRALGNTGSKLSTPLILSFLDAESNNYTYIKLIVIDALYKVTDDLIVLSRLDSLLQEDPSAECAAAIIETLQMGFEFMETREQDVIPYSSQVKSQTLLYSLAEAVSSSNDTDLHIMMAEYLKKVKADDEIFDLLYSGSSPPGSRGKRQTSDWDSDANPDYNYVDSQINRQFDVNLYDRHDAYIGARRLGVDLAHLRIAYGYFAGRNSMCDKIKVFGRFKVVGSLIGFTKTIADVKINVEAATGSGVLIVYAKLISNTLIDYNSQGNNSQGRCRPYTRTFPGYQTRLFSISHNVWIYVGILRLSIDVDGHFNFAVNANVCLGRTRTEVTGALAAFSPTVGVTLSGTASASLLVRS